MRAITQCCLHKNDYFRKRFSKINCVLRVWFYNKHGNFEKFSTIIKTVEVFVGPFLCSKNL